MTAQSSQTGYVRIWNTLGGPIARAALLLMGLSTKRGDDSTIGQFGSGIKFAPIAALRKGYEFVVCGWDDEGRYQYEMVPVKNSPYGEIEFVFNDGVRKASSYTLGAGEVSWDQDFYILREAIANAKDACAGGKNTWGWNYDDAIEPEEGMFEIYITASEGVREVMDNFDKWFAFERKKAGAGWVKEGAMTKAEISPLRAYCHGIFVHEMNLDSLFDYDFSYFELNEERTLKDPDWQLALSITREMKKTHCRQVAEAILKHVKFSPRVEIFELSNTVARNMWGDPLESYASQWRDAWAQMFGPNAVLVSKTEDATVLAVYNYKPVLVHEDAYNILKKLGCPTGETAVAEIKQRERIIDWNIDSYDKLLTAIIMVLDVFPEMAKPIDKIGVWDTSDKLYGCVTIIDGEKKILIAKNHVTDDTIQNIVATIVHECDHWITGIKDGDDTGRSFRDVADRHIGDLVVKMYNMKNNNKEAK